MGKSRILVTGAGGFIGHHLVKRLKAEGNWVRGADIKLPEYERSAADEFEVLDLRKYENCLLATRGGIDQFITSRRIWAESAISLPTSRTSRATTF